MSRGVILYQSKYGATKKYVDWLVKETNFHFLETKKATLSQLDQYEMIILGGGIYASGILGLSFLRKNMEQLKHKKIAVFCVGASPYDDTAFKQVYTHNFNKNLTGIQCFYCRGALDEQQMTFQDKMLCKILQKTIAKKDPTTYAPLETALMSALGKQSDWTDKKYLDPVIEFIRSESHGTTY
jgi:menaquinone-dependent protoporphyrinogen IX oxidase